MEKVILIIPPHAGRTVSEFPLGIGYIANQVNKAGFEAEILDIHALNLSSQEVTDRLKQSKSKIFGISVFSTQYNYYVWLIKAIKAIDKKNFIIAGGPLPTHQYDLVLKKTETDVCVIGEGDITISQLLANLDNYKQTNGIAFINNKDEVVVTPKQKLINLDDLEFQPYHLFPEKNYFKILGRGVNIILTRGCPYNCSFCSKTITGLRVRSIAHLEAELRHLIARYAIKGVRFSDELAITSKNRGYELCDLFAKLRLTWGGQVRVDIVDYKLLKAMKKSGCVSLGAGVESGSQRILDKMNKRTTVKQNMDFILNCKKVGILPWVQFIFGYPGENDSTIQESIKFFKKAHYAPPRPDYVGQFMMTSIATPLPGSRLYTEYRDKGIIGDESAYLRKAEKGYYISDPSNLICNLTDYSNDVLFNKKKSMEQTIWDNYRNRENSIIFRLIRLIRDILEDSTIYIKNLPLRQGRSGLLIITKKIRARFRAFKTILENRSILLKEKF
ncbi:MAG: B12-binding domain-containing radical SAM protein [Desulfobacterales bacterium]|nr:B12-binding domain-containing radical SAM protein [Desulfobacterales bacterium]